MYAVCLNIVLGHVCILKKRPDPAHDNMLRWSVLYAEVCLCQAGLRINRFVTSCTETHEDPNADVWFVDEPEPLARRQNWNKEAMDRLLGRAVYCCEY